MGRWNYEQTAKRIPKLRNPILIEGLPGIGNVGKVAVDFMIEEMKAKSLFAITSHSLPHSVFVTENNLVELPKIEVYYKIRKDKKRDLIFLSGDIQPTDEEASYEFTESILQMFKSLGGKEIITIGGIGLPTAPENPDIYCTGTSKEMIAKYKKGTKLSDDMYGVVGPIVGVTGLLMGLGQQHKMDGICILAETYGHPLYLGMKGSQKVLAALNKKLDMKLNLKGLGKEIKEVEEEILKRTEQLSKMKNLPKGISETSYIG